MSIGAAVAITRLDLTAGELRQKPHLHRIDGGDTAALLALISSLQARAARGLDAAIDVVCCFEAGRDGFWLHRL